MDNAERLQKLKQLQVTDKNRDALRSHDVLLAWIDKVAPLLKYDPQHYDTFINSARTASVPLSSKSITHYLNIAISTVNQAIIELENGLMTETNIATNPSDNKAPISKEKKSISLINIAEGVIIFILGLLTLWIINHYFPFINL
jgi:hypothetical protein